MIDITSYRIHTDKVIYEPKGMPQQKAIENAGRISAFENMPVELHVHNQVFNVQVAKLKTERVR